MDEEAFWSNVVQKCYPEMDDTEEPPKTAALRRLWYESHIIAMSELRNQVERTGEDIPRHIPMAEREARKDLLKKRLHHGLEVVHEHDPADCTINRFLSMLETNVPTWLPWERCPTFHQEVTTTGKKGQILPDRDGVLKERTVKKNRRCTSMMLWL